jgi:SAM-dependent methyltransferase
MKTSLTLAQAQDIIADCSPQPHYYRDHYRRMEYSYLPDLCAWFAGREPGSICDVGPGHGTLMVWLASRGWDVTVMDIMPRGHWISGEVLTAWGARYVQRDVLVAPLARRFGVVIMTQVIPHLRHRPDRALRHCVAMMEEGAPLVTSVNVAGHYGPEPPPYAHWREVPEWGTCPPRAEIVQCRYDEAAYRDLLESVFAANVVWRSRTGAVLLAESRAATER